MKVNTKNNLFLNLCALTIMLLCAKGAFCAENPNVILISIDTLRADHLSCYGYSRKTSANIDTFANSSVLFKNVISQAPETAPAHMSIFTALTPAVHKVMTYRENKIFKRLDNNVETLPVLMKRSGYLTAGLHGGGNVSGDLGFDRGFDMYHEWGDMLEPDARIEDVRKIIKESKRDGKPLFLFLHHYICHDPYLNSPKEFSQHFLSKKIPGLPISQKNIIRSEDFAITRESFWKKVDMRNLKHRDHIVSLYDGGIYYSDYIFGELIKTFKEENFYDNSLIILFSDHGEEFYEHLDNLHWRLFVETLHVPLIMKFPGNKYERKVIHDYVRTFDLMPTVFDLLQIKSDNFMQGVSFLPLLTGKQKYGPLIVSYADGGMLNGTGYIRFVKDGFIYSNQPSKGTEEWLFDAEGDHEEINNVAAVNSEIIGQARIIARIILEKDTIIREKLGYKNEAIIERNGKLMDQLRSLGYLQ